ncbi:cysteine desulfurase family protein [Evansella cellulosilytica]|uniref:cysteine desulfurase n=1 Tax=Evansella cellulosilytica (strain ATCC 21833 / DSM 2522 / FERM P-1141 / JCM 9156 / N-4) TaxID=649639 RepID=E6TV96_EVAC2|nr:cysteine desulfurase family protein [Evansella cellulosilytica]ADU29780.1 aminotransferase class V [Evansella cellulosilytica DSM 2522]
MERIYLDHAATSPVHPEVVKAMMPYYEDQFGNPSSIHSFGREARRGLDESREYIARKIGASFEDIIFTSGGTEADNLAIIGYAVANQEKGKHLITTKIEHHGVLHAFEHLEKLGFLVTYIDVDESGRVTPSSIINALKEDTILVSCMFGNNEVGTVQPIKEIGELLKPHQAVFHTDAVQAFGLIPIDVRELGVDFLAVSAHKINGPKGIGFLYANSKQRISPLFFGGEQERKRRAGTENVAGVVGLKRAMEIAYDQLEEKRAMYEEFQRILIHTFQDNKLDFQINGHREAYLPHILNISFPGMNVESILMNLDIEGIAVSSGSACTAGSIDPSHVLTAMFDDKNRSHSAVRFSFGYGLTEEMIKKAAEKTVDVIRRLTK